MSAMGTFHSDHAKDRSLDLIRLADYEAPPAPKPLVGPMLMQGYPTVLYGDGESGKSLFAAALAVSVASGRSVVGDWTPRRGRVLILDYETDAGDWKRRVERLSRGAGLAAVPPGLLYLHPHQDLIGGMDRIVQIVRAERPELVIVDSVGAGLPEQGPNADPSDRIMRFKRALDSLDATVLLIDHVAKSGYGIYGSVYKRNAVREVFGVKARSSGDLTLIHDKANLRKKLPKMKLRIEFNGEAGPITVAAEVDLSPGKTTQGKSKTGRRGTARQEIHALLEADPSLTNAEIVKSTGHPEGTVKVNASAWRKTHRSQRPERLVMVTSPKGRDNQ